MSFSLDTITNGGASPKFAHESKGSILMKKFGEKFSLTCPAQGYPLPSFRCVVLFCTYKFLGKFAVLSLEPIGGAKPKFSLVTKVLHLEHEMGKSIALSCPAQGFPLPAFRLV